MRAPTPLCEHPPRASRHAKKRCACARYLVSVVAPRTGPFSVSVRPLDPAAEPRKPPLKCLFFLPTVLNQRDLVG